MELRPEEKRCTLSVGELSRLIADDVYSPSPLTFSLRGKLGASAHRQYQQVRSQNAGFRQEVSLDVELPLTDPALRDWTVRVRGRLDGLITELDGYVVEELKTLALPASRFNRLTVDDFPRHRLQLEIYLHLLSRSQPHKRVAGRLIYLNLISNHRRAFEIIYQPASLETLVQQELSNLLQSEIRRQQERVEKLRIAAQIRFPFKGLRRGQGEMISEIQSAIKQSETLLLEAPTGLGKTVAALFAILPFALEEDRQVFFLTSKTTQQDLVFLTAQRLKAEHRFPRILLLRARQKLCPLGSDDCPPSECVYLNNFKERVRSSGVIAQLLEVTTLTPEYLREVGERETLCPHELQRLLTDEADLLIGDYNYVFDPAVRLERFFSEGDPSRLILIVDEAHNLPERARSYYTRQLSLVALQEALGKIPSPQFSPLREIFAKIQAQFQYYLQHAPRYPEPHPILLSGEAWSKIGGQLQSAFLPYWFHTLEHNDPTETDPVINIYRQCDDFVRLLNQEGDHFAHLLRRLPQPFLEVFCLDASRHLQDTFSSVHSSVCLSATLQPFAYYQELLGITTGMKSQAYPSPFPREHCRVFSDPTVTTLFREREANIESLVAKIAEFQALVRVNTMVFFPSFELLRRVTDPLPKEKLFLQTEHLSDRSRQELLSGFKKSRQGLLCAVLGGVFAEGIDLPGRLAEAAIIVGVGLPQVGTENELIRAYYERKGCDGFHYAYLYPGMRRVIQAAGRLIRSATDRGIILLLDRRYAQQEYQQLLPQHWYHHSPAELIRPDWSEEIKSSNLLDEKKKPRRPTKITV